MKFVLLTPWISPHQLPLAEALAELVGAENFRYHYLEPPPPNHVLWGWDKLGKQAWCRIGTLQEESLLTCDVLLTGVRDLNLMEERERRGKKTLYMSERWFKPPIGKLRLLHPRYFQMARRLTRLICAGKHFAYLPIGIHAARDAAFLLRYFGGRSVSVEMKRYNPMDPVLGQNAVRMWGYFVTPSTGESPSSAPGPALRVLWVGRFLKLKHVEDIIRAVRSTTVPMQLTLVGKGPTLTACKRLAADAPNVIFRDPVPIWQVRELMRQNDVYVLSSDAYEGWGAVVSEALEEHLCVIATEEAGASATILPRECLYRAGDWRTLARRLVEARSLPCEGIGAWSAREAAHALVKYCQS